MCKHKYCIDSEVNIYPIQCIGICNPKYCMKWGLFEFSKVQVHQIRVENIENFLHFANKSNLISTVTMLALGFRSVFWFPLHYQRGHFQTTNHQGQYHLIYFSNWNGRFFQSPLLSIHRGSPQGFPTHHPLPSYNGCWGLRHYKAADDDHDNMTLKSSFNSSVWWTMVMDLVCCCMIVTGQSFVLIVLQYWVLFCFSKFYHFSSSSVFGPKWPNKS